MNEKSQDQQKQQPNPPEGYPPPTYFYQSPFDVDRLNIIEIFRVIWAHKWLIALVIALSTGVAIAVALMSTPIYRASILLSPVSDQESNQMSNIAGQFGDLAALAGINVGGGNNRKIEALAYLRSRAIAERFIEDEKLIQVIFSDKWDETKEKWKVDNKKDEPTIWDAYKIFNSSIRRVSEERKSGLVTLSIEWKDPNLAADWAGKLVKRVNKHMRDSAVQESEKNLKYLRSALSQTSSVEVHEAIYRIIESQIKTIMFAKSREEYSFKVIDPPVVPEDKVKPQRRLIALLGSLIGLLVGLIIAFVLNYLKSKPED